MKNIKEPRGQTAGRVACVDVEGLELCRKETVNRIVTRSSNLW